MDQVALAAVLIAGMAGQYFAGQAPTPDPKILAEMGAPAALGPKLAAKAAKLGPPSHWDCKLEGILGVEDRRFVPPDDWGQVLARVPKPAEDRRAQAEAYWRSRAVVFELERQTLEGARARVDASAIKPALDAILAAEPDLETGHVPPDQAAFDHYASSAGKRLREVAASVPPKRGWKCHDVERALWVLDNAVKRMAENQPAPPR